MNLSSNNPVGEIGLAPRYTDSEFDRRQAQWCGETDSEDRRDEYAGAARMAYIWGRKLRKERADDNE